MNTRVACFLISTLLAACLLAPAAGAASGPEPVSEPGPAEGYRLPLRFEPNWGQTDQQVQFISRGAGYSLFLAADGANLSLGQAAAAAPAEGSAARSVVKTKLMIDIAVKETLDKLPVTELDESLGTFLAPLMAGLPDRRLQAVVPLSVRGIIGSESPVVTQMAQQVARDESGVWAAAKRIYRFLGNERVEPDQLSQGLYERSGQSIRSADPAYVVVALDPVNFEKPYTTELEGVSTVHKSTPPSLSGQARLARGYPALTATVVNTPVPAVTYAHWFSYTAEFISQNWEINQAITATNQLLPDYKRRYVTDSGLDDQKLFAALSQDEFVIRASHLERLVEVYNDRLDRWETEPLQALVETAPFSHTFKVTFTHARKDRRATIHIGWLALRLPQTHQRLWASHYLVLRGLSALIQTLVTLSFLSICPFPHQVFTYG